MIKHKRHAKPAIYSNRIAFVVTTEIHYCNIQTD